MKGEQKSVIARSLFRFNVCFWIYFWIAFAVLARRYAQEYCADICLDPYVIFGHGIGLSENPLSHVCIKSMLCLQFPSFAIATALQKATNLDGSATFLRTSVNGYRLLVTMVLSFGQWYFIALVAKQLMNRRRVKERPSV